MEKIVQPQTLLSTEPIIFLRLVDCRYICNAYKNGFELYASQHRFYQAEYLHSLTVVVIFSY